MAVSDDNEAFIECVKKRPGLYDKSSQDYGDPKTRRRLWCEVCSEVVTGFREMNPSSRAHMLAVVQKKWLNLRTCFAREFKMQQKKLGGDIYKKKRRYIYYDKLLFLKSNLTFKTRRSPGPLEYVVGPDEVDIEDNNFDSSRSIEVESYPSQSFINKSSTYEEKPPDSNTPYYQEMLMHVLKDNADEDRNFALSLVPTLQSLGEDLKLHAKIEILKLLRKIKSERTVMLLENANLDS